MKHITAFYKQDKSRLAEPVSIVLGVILGLTPILEPAYTGLIGSGLAMLAGFYLLIKTSDTVVNNAASIGKKAGISPMALGIGLGVMTSMPELFVSAGAIIAGSPGIGIGNIVGSNIANVFLILGATAAIKAIHSKGKSWRYNIIWMTASTVAFAGMLAHGSLSIVVGLLMLSALGYYMYASYRLAQKDHAEHGQDDEHEHIPEEALGLSSNALLGVMGVLGLIGAAALLVASATAFGIAAGVSPVVIGVLAVAIGTSLPEVMVNIKSALKGSTDMAVGNILGSNIFNVMMIGGILSLSGTAVPDDINPLQSTLGAINMAAFVGCALLTWLVMHYRKGQITKTDGYISLAIYAVYTLMTVATGNIPSAE